ncbi:hypothetical protein PVAND_015614 [Polypedilum vanderplanki]|uniref:Uncharacterized protein n=1 Tax=Polypedilum vanderplanki TaxID=319348 RepID=A0A9J6BDH9_POLVA|nr:hypothetical protein PVAND_015614 [Polypedilum vanderplanki]
MKTFKLSIILIFLFLKTFSKAQSTVILLCDYKDSGGTYNEVVLTFYSCIVPTTFIISQPKVKISSINDESNKNLVKAIQANDGTIKYFSNSFGDFFPNVIYISVINSKLLEIRRENLEKFEQLKVIYLCNNQLEFLERDLFVKNKLLSFVYLNDNNFKFVDSATFNGLFYLEYLSMENAGCIHQQARNRHAVINLTKKAANQCNDEIVIDDIVKRDQKEFLESCNEEIFIKVCHLDSNRKISFFNQLFEEKCQKLIKT